MGIERLPESSQAKLNEILRDGKITAEEVQGLTKAELDALKQLGGELPGPGEVVEFSTRGKSEPKAEAEPKRSWAERLGIGAAIIGATTAIGGLIGAAGGALAGGVGAIPGAAAGAKLGALAGAALVGLSSCSKDDTTIITGDKNITNNIQVTVSDGTKTLLEELIKLMKEGQAEDAKRHKELMDKLNDIIANGEANGETLKMILESFEKLGGRVDDIVKLLMEQGKSIKDITDALQQIGKNTSEIIKLLQAQGVTMTEILVQLGDNNKILTEISKGNSNIEYWLKAIHQATKDGNKISADNQKLLNQILEKLNSLPLYDKEFNQIQELLERLLQKVTESVQQNEKMDTQTHKLLQSILDNLQNFNADVKNIATEILGRLDDLSNEQKTFFNMVMEKFHQLEESGKANTEKLLDAINNNTTVAKGTYNVAIEILKNIEKLGGKADTIIDVITNIGTGGNVDLSKIEGMLDELLKQSKNNGDLLSSIDSKLNLVAITLEGLKVNIGEGNEKLLAKLDEILKKIPEGCHCEKVDLSEIVAKLEIIIKHIQENPNDTNEGIFGDLEDLLG